MRLRITDPGSLLSVVIDREVNEEQVRLVRMLLDTTEVLDGQDMERLEEVLNPTLFVFGYDAPLGAGDAVEAYRG